MTGVARGNGSSAQPEVVGVGDYIVFASTSTSFGAVGAGTEDRNGVADAFLWSGKRNASQRVNYVLFETSDPFADLALVRQRAPERLRSPAATYAAALRNPAFHQVYLRYLGAKYPNG